MTGTFYRIVTAGLPPVEDFTSAAALGLLPPDDALERHRLHGGISVYATEAQARNKARAYPLLGSYLARLEVPPDAPIRVERTLRGSRGHHTLWGEPDVIRRCVVAVVPV